MWTNVEINYNKIQPKHIKNVIFKFQEPPHPTQLFNMHLCWKTANQLQSTQGHSRTNQLGHQQENYTKIPSQATITSAGSDWLQKGGTCSYQDLGSKEFFIAKDIKYKDNLEASSLQNKYQPKFNIIRRSTLLMTTCFQL